MRSFRAAVPPSPKAANEPPSSMGIDNPQNQPAASLELLDQLGTAPTGQSLLVA